MVLGLSYLIKKVSLSRNTKKKTFPVDCSGQPPVCVCRRRRRRRRVPLFPLSPFSFLPLPPLCPFSRYAGCSGVLGFSGEGTAVGSGASFVLWCSREVVAAESVVKVGFLGFVRGFRFSWFGPSSCVTAAHGGARFGSR